MSHSLQVTNDPTRTGAATIVSYLIYLVVLFLFAVLWPVDLLLHYNLATNGVATTARVVETWESLARSKQTIYHSRIEFDINDSTYRVNISSHPLKPGDTVDIRYAKWWPGYVSVGPDRPEPPAKITVIMRFLLGSVFSMAAFAGLLNARSRKKKADI